MSIIARNQRIILASSPQFGRRKTWVVISKKRISGQREVRCRLVDFAALKGGYPNRYIYIVVSAGCGCEIQRTGMPKGFDAPAPAHQIGAT